MVDVAIDGPSVRGPLGRPFKVPVEYAATTLVVEDVVNDVVSASGWIASDASNVRLDVLPRIVEKDVVSDHQVAYVRDWESDVVKSDVLRERVDSVYDAE